MAKKSHIELVYDFMLWGINSNMEDYRLCLNMNKHLHWDFKREDDIEYKHPVSKSLTYFNTYRYINEIDFYTLELIQNKKNGSILIPELKNIDYFFLLHGEDDYFEEDAFTELLANTPGVQSVIQLDIRLLKSKQNLLIRYLNEQNKKENQDSSYYWAGE